MQRLERNAATRIGLGAPGDRYGALLLVLILTYLLSAFTSRSLIGAVQTVFFVAALLLALRNSPLRRGSARLVIACLLLGSAIAVALALTQPTGAGAGVADLWIGLLLLATVVIIVRRILGHTEVTLQSIYGALSAYLIIGLMFAACYAAMNRLGSGPFFTHGSPGNTETFQYFSFTTLTTLGYGDFTAASNAGRAVAVLEALIGQVFLATLVARLVATFRAAQPRE
jgi:hypothetical protein